jgi:hypothetical protein
LGRGEKVIKRACKADRIGTRTPGDGVGWKRQYQLLLAIIELSKSVRSFKDARKLISVIDLVQCFDWCGKLG